MALQSFLLVAVAQAGLSLHVRVPFLPPFHLQFFIFRQFLPFLVAPQVLPRMHCSSFFDHLHFTPIIPFIVFLQALSILLVVTAHGSSCTARLLLFVLDADDAAPRKAASVDENENRANATTVATIFMDLLLFCC